MARTPGRPRRDRGRPWLARGTGLAGFCAILLGASVALFGLMLLSGPAEFAPELGAGICAMLLGLGIAWAGWRLMARTAL